MIASIVLAAGASSRMGQPKALLRIGETTFIRHIVEVLRSARVTDITVVLGSHADEISRELSWFDGTVVRNPDWEKGQISSLAAGLAGLDREDVHGVLICPVDHPLITQSTVVELLQAFWRTGKSIIVPTYEGSRGHPVIFRSTLFGELRQAVALQEGARAVVRSHSEDTLEVPVGERGILVDVDTPDDYADMHSAVSGKD